MLENVVLNEEGDKFVPDYFDVSKTQNGRVSYPIFHIDNYVSNNTYLDYLMRNYFFNRLRSIAMSPAQSTDGRSSQEYHILNL